MTQAIGPVEVTYILPIGGGGVAVPWRYLTALGHSAEFQNAASTPILNAVFGVDYRITPDGDTAPNAGTLTLLLAPPVAATKLVLRRTTAKTQNYAATPGAEGVEKALDRLTLALQEYDSTGSGGAPSAFEALYLGSKAADPTTDNQGNTLLVGALYFHTGSNALRVWNGAVWAAVSGSGAQASDPALSALAALVYAANRGIYATGPDAFALYVLTAFGRTLSGVADDAAARTALGLGPVAVQSQIPFSMINPAMVRTGVEGIVSDETDEDELTTVKAVADFVRALIQPTAPIAAWDWSANVTTIPLVNLAGWDSVRLVGDLTCTAGSLALQLSADNGATYRAANYDGRVGNPGGAVNISTSIGLEVATGTAFRFNNLIVDQMSSAARRTSGSGLIHRVSAGQVLTDAFGTYLTAEVHNALQILGATFTAGWIRVYGLRRA
jgi:hypothetical protein